MSLSSPAGTEHATTIAIITVDEDDPFSGVENSSTASLTSSILNFRELYGRTYQNVREADYWLPNDEPQKETFDITDHVLWLTTGKLFHAPLRSDIQSVLDVGTGTGLWAIDFADQYPSASVTGIDLSPIQPDWVPPNCKFEIDDALREWTFPDESFDYVHIRCLCGAVPDWTELYKQVYRHLKPGGWIEHTEISYTIIADDHPIPYDSPYRWWNKLFRDAGAKMGMTFEPTVRGQNEPWMREAGFTGEFHVESYKIPIGTWSTNAKLKEVGAYNLLACKRGLDGFTLRLGMELSHSHAEMVVYCAEMRKAYKSQETHGYYTCWSTWSQKPFTTDPHEPATDALPTQPDTTGNRGARAYAEVEGVESSL